MASEKISDMGSAGTLSSADLLPIVQSGVNKAATIGGFIVASGINDFAANQSMGTHKLTNVSDPASAQDAATKNYVDMAVAALAPKNDCAASTTSVLATATYSNGSSGVGATLTMNVAAVLILDGYTVALGDRLLIKNQASAFQNGIYSVTTLGTISVQTVLTRTTDFNQAGDGINGALVYVLNGTTNGNTLWSCTTEASITFGTTNINWSKFLGTTYTADGTTLALTGTVFSCLTAPKLSTARSITITGDLTYTTSFDGSGNVTAAGTLATVNTNVGTFTFASVTVNGKGLITAASSGSSPDGSITISSATAVINPNWLNGFALINGYVACSVGSSALTIAIKTIGGGDPSSSSPVTVLFRDVTSATGDYTSLVLTAATSLVISSGSTLGFTNATAGRIWIVGFNDGGTFRLGAINCLSGTSVYPLRNETLASSTAEGGAGAADSSQVIYTGTAVSNKALRILAYAEWSSGLTTAGTWDAVPTKIQLFGTGVSLPGESVQQVTSIVTSSTSGTGTFTLNTTIPTNTNGNQFLSQAITPISAANVLVIDSQSFVALSISSATVITSLFQDSVSNALATAWQTYPTAAVLTSTSIHFEMIAGTTSQTTIKSRSGGSAAGTTYLNRNAATIFFTGNVPSYLRIEEIQG